MRRVHDAVSVLGVFGPGVLCGVLGCCMVRWGGVGWGGR
jgi:hypothetical protein